MPTDTFQDGSPVASGPLKGDYLWSVAANWSAGVPGSGGSASVGLQSYDDVLALTLSSLTLSVGGGVQVLDGSLIIGTVSGVGGTSLTADGYLFNAAASITVGTIIGAGGSYGAVGATSTFINNSATDAGEDYSALDGKVVLAAAPADSSRLIFGGTGTFALEAPQALTNASLEGVTAGDVLELPGSSVSSVTYGANTLSITTSAGTFAFSHVTYTGAALSGYNAAVDGATGLVAVTFTTPDVFHQATAQTTGPLSGDYLWSTTANWSAGVPANGASVTVSAASASIDDLSNVSVSTLSLGAGAAVQNVGGLLNVATVAGGGGAALTANGSVLGVTATVTVGAINGTGGNYGAVGATSSFVDNAATDPGENYFALNGRVVLTGNLSAASTLNFGSTGTFALEHPNSVTNPAIAALGAGDVLELPGGAVSGMTIGPNSLSVTTDAGTYVFSSVTYGGTPIAGFTASEDPTTGLQAIRFTAADQFQARVTEPAGPFSGSYLWSNQTNWSAGVPTDGASVGTAAAGIDDLAHLDLGTLTLSSGGGVADYGGALNIGTVSFTGGASLTADADIAGLNARPTVTVGSIISTGGSFGAVGPNATFIDNSTIDAGESYSAFNGTVVLAAAPAANSTLNYLGSSGTFALEHPNSVTTAAISGLGAGDVLELPGTAVTGVTFSSHGLLVTTNAGSFDFSNVTYNFAPIAGYGASVDAATGLEAIRFTAADQFQARVTEPAGPFSGSSLWSNQTNWSAGVPTAGASVSSAAAGIDDLANLNLAALTLGSGGGVADYGGALNIGTVSLAAGASLTADADLAAVTAIPTVTVGSIATTGGSFGAVGPNATFIDSAAFDPGETYSAFNGKVVLAPAVADTSTLNYFGSSGTFALEHPNTVTNAAINGLRAGDVLELPGTVSSVTFGSSTLSVSTSTGAFFFSHVNYSGATSITGYTLSTDAGTGLTAITFTTPDVFQAVQAATNGPFAGEYLWSTAANWSQGVPVNGASVQTAAAGIDDLASLSLNALTLSSGGGVADYGGALHIGTVTTAGGGSLTADADIPGLNASPTVIVGTLTAAGGSFGAVGPGATFIDNFVDDPGESYSAINGTVVLAAAPADNATLNFLGSSGTIALEHPRTANPVAINGLKAGDTLELPGTTVASLTFGSNFLDVTTDAGTFDFTNVHYVGTVNGYSAAIDAATGLEAITLACFLSGTQILTERGEVPVQDLSIGERVVTASGELKPVRWLGSRHLDCRRYADPTLIWPICFRAGAFALNQPSRDLYVSPGHAVLIGGVLIQAEKLINGATILQVPRARVEYWHVELDAHDCLLSDGLPTESYLDSGNRTAFANGGAFIESHPDFRPRHWAQTCVPLVLEGEAIRRAKAALLERARELGHATTADADVHLLADGKRVEPILLADQRWAFILPAAGADITLRCRTFVPSHIDPSSQDARALGLCVARWQIDGVEVPLTVQRHFEAGWHGVEEYPDGRRHRWSRGEVRLPAGTRLLVIEVACPSHCWAPMEDQNIRRAPGVAPMPWAMPI